MMGGGAKKNGENGQKSWKEKNPLRFTLAESVLMYYLVQLPQSVQIHFPLQCDFTSTQNIK